MCRHCCPNIDGIPQILPSAIRAANQNGRKGATARLRSQPRSAAGASVPPLCRARPFYLGRPGGVNGPAVSPAKMGSAPGAVVVGEGKGRQRRLGFCASSVMPLPGTPLLGRGFTDPRILIAQLECVIQCTTVCSLPLSRGTRHCAQQFHAAYVGDSHVILYNGTDAC